MKKMAEEIQSYKLDDKDTKRDVKDIRHDIKPLFEHQEVL